jgi:hypothetical protein
MGVVKQMIITVSCKPPVDAFQPVGISERNGIKIRRLMLDITKAKYDTDKNQRKCKLTERNQWIEKVRNQHFDEDVVSNILEGF